ncbi:hypothetical protein EU546_08100, partial [Candidatus Thorarchaeota archaeon]
MRCSSQIPERAHLCRGYPRNPNIYRAFCLFFGEVRIVYSGCSRLVLVLIVAFSLSLLSRGPQNVVTNVGSIDRPDIESSLATYTQHSPIVINHDENFTTQGWPGNGTVDDPYRIEGLNITHNGDCIRISDTRVWFVIDSCLLLSNQTGTGTGISLSNVTNAVMWKCTIEDFYSGIYTTESQNVKILNCSLTNIDYGLNLNRGLLPVRAENLTLGNNSFSECGTAIFADYCSCSVSSNNVTGGSHAIWLHYPTDFEIRQNNFTQLSGFGVRMLLPSGVSITENQMTSIGSDAIYFDEGGDHANISRNTIVGCGTAIHGYAIDYSRIENNTIKEALGYGIYVASYTPTNITLERNLLRHIGSYGVYAVGVDNFTMKYNSIYFTQGIGVGVSGVGTSQDYLVIESNTVLGSENRGMDLNNAHRVRFHNNTIAGCNNNGVDVYLAQSQISNNTIYRNTVDGMYIDGSDSVNITGNKVYSNGDRGIYIYYEGGNHRAVSNSLGWNTGLNAVDETSSLWDDGVSTGNKWSDYSGTGNYSPPGSFLTDRFPQVLTDVEAPELSHPGDVTYEVTQSGNRIEWSLQDAFPSLCTVFMNGTLSAEEVWVTRRYNLNLDGFEPGWHNLTLIASDGAGNNATDQVWVHVIDPTPPSIDSPADADYELGTSHYNITWNASDDYPKGYVLLRNGTTFKEGEWNGL